MKKVISILISITILLSIVGCNKKIETAEEATNKALIAVQELDISLANKYFDLDEIKEREIVSNLDIDITDFDMDDLKIAKLFVKNFQFEILDSKEDQDTAKVDVTLTNTDMSLILKEYFEYAFELAFEQNNKDAMETKLQDRMIELLSSDDVELKTTKVTLDLYKDDSNWKIKLSPKMVDAMLGGLLSIADQFGN